MNRLQKKCLIATAGSHLLLVVILLVGPGFFTAKSKPDDIQVLTVIPDVLNDTPFSSGVKNAPLPPPTPIVKPPAPQPVPTPPQPVVKPVEPVRQPEPEPVKEVEKPTPDAVEPLPKPKPPTHEVKISLTPVVRQVPLKTPDNTAAENEAKAAARAAKRRAAAIASAAQAIKANSSSATTVEMPGTGSVSYANYAAAVKTIYEAAWTPPDDTSSDDANTKVSVTIARDGAVVSSHIISRSGDARVDASVQRTLERVTFVRPFPDGAKEKERTFIINFNLKAKRMLG